MLFLSGTIAGNYLILWLILGFSLVGAVCDYGFSVTNPQNISQSWVFTDMLESDFTQVKSIAGEKDWIRQGFNVSAQAGHGKYAKVFRPSNVVFHPSSKAAQGVTDDGGNDAGLLLHVDSDLDHEAIISSEIDTVREDFMYGSFRAGMKLTNVNGTCGAFFWYRNNTQEIDIEFLSQQFDRELGVFPVNLVIQSKESMEAGYDAKATGTFKQINLTFDPTTEFHEYRFDYVPGHVLFYADSELLTEMEGEAVPSSAGRLILQHWSNGNPLWSGGPPKRDAVLTISYVKAYFNKTGTAEVGQSSTGQYDYNSDDTGVCVVPNVTAGNASTGGEYFGHENQAHSSGSDTESSADQCSLRWTSSKFVVVVLYFFQIGITWLALESLTA